MWSFSLVLSLSCALVATSMQQWARKYLEFVQYRGTPRKRARIRAYMFDGVKKFGFSQAVEIMPLQIHLSVFLFFAGLIDFFLHINKVIAFSILGLTVLLALNYAQYTLLPFFSPNSLYYTPLSELLWHIWQLVRIYVLFYEFIIRGVIAPSSISITAFSNRFKKFYERLKHGLWSWVEASAMGAQPEVDASALHWTLTILDEHTQFEDFAACMPGFFDSSADPDGTPAMLSLLSDHRTSHPILGFRFHDLLQSCRPENSLVTEKQRKSRLRVCLKSLWYCLRAHNQPKYSEKPLATYVRDKFASPEVIRWIQNETDLATSLLASCFWSLVVKKLAKDTTSSTDTSTTAELDCLSSILGTDGDKVKEWLSHEGAIDLANVVWLTSNGFDKLTTPGAEVAPFDVLDVFLQTLSIVAEGIFPTDVERDPDDLPPDLMAQFRDICSKLAHPRVPDSLKEQLQKISDKFPPSSLYAGEEKVKMHNPELESDTTP